MIKVILITGFLGAGKTTLVNNLLKIKKKKVGVLVNEFGKTGIDGKLIKGTEENITELNNGSIFCSCIKEDFIKALAEIKDYEIEYLFIEASGLSDPSNIKKILHTVEKVYNYRYNFSGSICMVDALYFLQQYDLLPSLKRQIEHSHTIIINKVDLQNQDEIDKIEKLIKEINPESYIIKTEFAHIDQNIFNAIKDNQRPSEESTNTQESRPKTLVLKSNEVLDENSLYNFLEEMGEVTYRIKGFANTNNGSKEISVVGKNVNIVKWSKVEKTEIVFISSVGIKIISQISKKWKNYFEDKKYIL
ncbi:MAG: GTP-binding protein [Eubacteriales bacterium]